MNNDFDFIDQFARDALDKAEVKFNPKDWERMEKDLDKKKHWHPNLWLLKTVEGFTLALMILTVFNFTTQNSMGLNPALKIGADEIDQNANKVSKTITLEDVDATDTNRVATAGISPKNGTLSAIFTERLPANPMKNPLATHLPSIKQPKNPNRYTSGSNSMDPALKTKVIDNKTTRSLNSVSDNFLSKDLSEETTNQNTTEPLSQFSDSMSTSSSDISSNQLVSALHQKIREADRGQQKFSTQMLDALDFEPPTGDDDLLFELKKQELDFSFNPQLRIGFSAGCDYNTASTYGRGGIGGHVGMILDADITAFLFVTGGLNLAQKYFTTDETYTVDNSANEGLVHQVTESRRVDMALVTIPIMAHCTVFNNRRWKIAVGSGLGMNWIGVKHFSGSQYTTNQQHFGSIMMTTALNPLDYEQGLFQGGIIQNNFYLTTLASMSIERQLGSRLRLFVVPTYQHSISRFGASKGNLGTLSISVGLKTSINK